MTDETSGTSRRRVLRALGASGVAAVGTAGFAAGQADYTARLIIPEAEEFTDSYTGIFVYVEAQSAGELDAQEVANCEFDNWSPDGLDSFTGRLVDQIEDDHKDIPTQIFTKAGSGVEAGSLYVVNRSFTCPEGYVGLEAEQIRTENLATDEADAGGAETETTDGGGPGFGIAGAVAGVGGLAGLARALRDGEE